MKPPKDTSGTFYETEITCKNCKNSFEVHIKVGVSVKEYQKKNKCSICKCPLK